ncbi:hypothetical protein LTR37_000793 [Vermiconidia calcicola]|uniref:Uncharacterized protein n=1 Tax=Vermiconidia calcicola TaxID=1690605 RepID=A0ACC3NXY1_9PEZI|nr:hypothetical protein LTR37_000793 [Vermiconidia calcicola]
MAPASKRSTKTKMTSLIRSLTDRLTPTVSSVDLKPRPDGFQTAKGPDALFPRTKPEIDGEECLHDCETCSVHLPRGFKIDEDDKLYGHINGFSRHLIVATGKTDWVRDVADEKGSVMEAIGAHDKEVEEGGKLMLSASNMDLPDHNSGPYGEDRPTTVLLMPAFQFVDNVTPKHVPELIRGVINKASTNTSPLRSRTAMSNGTTAPRNSTATSTYHNSPLTLPAGLSFRNCPHKAVILMCSQATRDARCGQSAPLLRRELERHLRPLGLYRDLGDERPGGVGVYFISHVGGHKYSANMMVYRRAESRRTVGEQIQNGVTADGSAKGAVEGEAAQCIWLARVRPEDCENIVRFTVLQGKVVKPDRQLRGGFDRVRGVTLMKQRDGTNGREALAKAY